MALPTWDSDTVLNFKGRWNALNREGRRIENKPTTNDTSKLLLRNNTFPRREDLLPFREKVSQLKVIHRDGSSTVYFFFGGEYIGLKMTEGKPVGLNYTSLYEGLAHLLYTQPGNPPHESLIRHLDGSDNRASYYHELTIPKKRGGVRTLTVPLHPLKWVQRSLLLVLTHLFPRHKCAHGFERGKSIITHAKQHVGKRYVYTIDIKDFFPSITRNRVFGMLQAYPVKATTPVARYLANLTCHNGCLPQGTPTSPILSNLLCRRLDSRLFKWARRNGYTYSRYADDLTFSTNRDRFPEHDIAFIDDVIRGEGFEVNEEKRRLQPYYKRQMVTGLVVNEKLNLPREKLRGLRALLHNIEEHGWRSQVGRASVFETAEEWREYITADLDRKPFRKHLKKQADTHKLLNPAATLPHVRHEDQLRRVVRGKIEFVGAVRGQEDPIYQRMLDTFKRLSERLDHYTEQKKKGAERIRDQKEIISDDEEKRRENAPRYYATLMKHIEALEEDLSESEFREKLGEWENHSLEMCWLLERTDDAREEVIQQAKKIAYSLDTDPSETARFFRRFNDYMGFRGLLHPPSDPSVSPTDIIGACEELLSQFTLPNGIQKETREVIDRSDSWVDAHQDSPREKQYPWPPEGESTPVKENVLVPFKRHTRFNNRKRDEDLVAYLRDYAEKLPDSVDFNFPRKGKRFRTHVPSVLPALKKLLSSMAEHTKSDTVHVSVEEIDLGGFDGVEVSIWDEDSSIEEEPILESIFRGDTREALYHQTADTGLRGYARWTLIASFSNGSAYEFDVMQNQRNEAPEHDSGVVHRITFPK